MYADVIKIWLNRLTIVFVFSFLLLVGYCTSIAFHIALQVAIYWVNRGKLALVNGIAGDYVAEEGTSPNFWNSWTSQVIWCEDMKMHKRWLEYRINMYNMYAPTEGYGSN